MQLLNVTRNTHVAHDLKLVTSWSDQLFGLLKRSNPRTLMFKTRFGIHTFGLKKPIDVVILDCNFCVVGLKLSLKPNRLFFWNPNFDRVIELPNKTIKHSSTELQDILKLLS